jgi:hypothetical protein
VPPSVPSATCSFLHLLKKQAFHSCLKIIIKKVIVL